MMMSYIRALAIAVTAHYSNMKWATDAAQQEVHQSGSSVTDRCDGSLSKTACLNTIDDSCNIGHPVLSASLRMHVNSRT
jgi:hypothetical protein